MSPRDADGPGEGGRPPSSSVVPPSVAGPGDTLPRADVLARLEWAIEAIGDGATAETVAVLLALRDDLLAADGRRAA